MSDETIESMDTMTFNVPNYQKFYFKVDNKTIKIIGESKSEILKRWILHFGHYEV